ncbi:hypotheical protein [Mycobacterium phage PP]|uniref:Hypotheical protein n=1 Tax=Mycobacterium phage PP TaxID=2077134 RepID=A0A2Z5XVK5_9CAUD|nr:hypothetical protein KIW36_gp24 [Mycobacterium phage PP]BBC53867.1 hypotheical protein [Mycobacterium phage PP]
MDIEDMDLGELLDLESELVEEADSDDPDVALDAQTRLEDVRDRIEEVF